jgi:hypothetical protein
MWSIASVAWIEGLEIRGATLQASKRLGQPGLPQDRIRGVSARNTHRHCEIPFRDRAAPDFVAAFALPNESATGRAQQLPQRAVELRRH